MTALPDPADPADAARALVAELFPRVRWAVLTGSVVTGLRTAGSDLDIVVLLPDGGVVAPHRASRRFRGWPAELFVHDEPTLEHYLRKEFGARKPSLHRMLATGVVVGGDAAAFAGRREHCARVLEAGPGPLSAAERDFTRYGLIDLLDDLEYAADPGERVVIAATVWTAAARAALAFAGRWNGNGKWLLRELRDLDADLADGWLAAHGDPVAVAAFARRLLDRAGGPLFEGFHALAERPE